MRKFKSYRLVAFGVLSIAIALGMWLILGKKLARAEHYSEHNFSHLFENGNKIDIDRPMIFITGSQVEHRLINDEGEVKRSIQVYPGYYSFFGPLKPGKWEIDGLGAYDKVQIKILNGTGSLIKVEKNFYGLMIAALITGAGVVGTLILVFLAMEFTNGRWIYD